MTSDGTSKDDVKVPEGDLGKQIQGDFDEGKDLLVTIISAMGEEAVSYSSIPLLFLAQFPQLLRPLCTVLTVRGIQAISYKEAPKGA